MSHMIKAPVAAEIPLRVSPVPIWALKRSCNRVTKAERRSRPSSATWWRHNEAHLWVRFYRARFEVKQSRRKIHSVVCRRLKFGKRSVTIWKMCRSLLSFKGTLKGKILRDCKDKLRNCQSMKNNLKHILFCCGFRCCTSDIPGDLPDCIGEARISFSITEFFSFFLVSVFN